MRTIPQEALNAAAARLAAIDGKGAADPEHIRCASLILLDAAPHIVADERERVRTSVEVRLAGQVLTEALAPTGHGEMTRAEVAECLGSLLASLHLVLDSVGAV